MAAGRQSRRRRDGCLHAGRIRARSVGFTYLAVLLLVAVLGLGLAAASTLIGTAIQREQELELLFIGNQYRQAIGSYYETSPGGAKQFPPTLEALLKDERQPANVRHLRKLYRDPMTGKTDWVLVTSADGRITGVASRSTKTPLKQDNFANPLDRGFRAATMLSEWHFVYAPALVPDQAPGASPAMPAQPGASPFRPLGTEAGSPSPLSPPPAGSGDPR
jgi:type II secretory pathway pseudopilin PulG